jgi:NADH:ubiquinone oxidoreductase subunit B-like Fe-S oxidoreductase
MQGYINEQKFIKSFLCYEAPHLQQANMIIIWGALAPKLAALLSEYYVFLPSRYYITHVLPCNYKSHNYNNIGAHNIINCEELDSTTIKHAIKEARQCLLA